MLIEKILKEADRKRHKLYPQHVNRASSIGFPCQRFLIYSIVRWEEKEITDQHLQLIYDEGHKQERAVLLDLARNGVEVYRQQERVSFPEYRLEGHIDGVFKHRSEHLIEIKSVSDHIFPKVNTLEDFLKSSFPWHRCYPYQVNVYLRGLGLKRGLFILKNKNNGELKEIPFTYNKDLVEWAFWTCKKVNETVDYIRNMLQEVYDIKEIADFSKRQDAVDYMDIRAKACADIEFVMPDWISDLNICECCPFQHICLPDEIREDRIKIHTETPEFVSLLARREFLSSAHSEYMSLDREVKKYLKERKEEHFFISDGDRIAFEIYNGKQMKIEKVEVPDEKQKKEILEENTEDSQESGGESGEENAEQY